jgi:uncharacterized membrane protein
LRRLAGDRHGNFATMTALTAPVLLALSALVVDEAQLYFERRETQELVDLAAITAAANIDKAERAAKTVFNDNGIRDVVLATGNDGNNPELGTTPGAVAISVITGHYDADPEIETRQRFTAGATPLNAVKVTAKREGARIFAGAIIGQPTIAASAIASMPAEAAFSIGSRLLKVDGGLLNAVLGGLTGSKLSLSVMDYDALIDADVELFDFLDALASELHVTGGTYADVLESEATIGQIARAMASVSGTDPSAKAALLALAGQASAKATVPLDHLLDLGDTARLGLGQRPSGLSADVGAMEMLTAGAVIADGENQAHVDLTAAVPGLLGATLDIAIGEPPQFSPWFSVGGKGQVVRTAQTRLLLTVEIGGPGGLVGTSISLPLYLELAFAEATLKDVSCPTGRIASLKVAVSTRPGVADLSIGAIDAARLADFRKNPIVGPAKIIQAPLVTVSGAAHAEISNVAATTLTFSHADVVDHAIKTVASRDLTQSLTASLLGDLQLRIDVAGLGLGIPSGLTASLKTILGAATPSIDGLLYNVLAMLGVSVGEADVRVHGATCGRSVLVQ